MLLTWIRSLVKQLKITRSPYRIIGFILSVAIACSAFAVATHRIELPYTLGIQPANERCLDANLLLFHYGKFPVKRGDWVMFRPFGALSYVREPYVVKIASGVPGDHLVIKHSLVLVNDKLVAVGLDDAPIVQKNASQLERDEIIPADSYFVTATHPLSFDSRYWGYLKADQVEGLAKRLF